MWGRRGNPHAAFPGSAIRLIDHPDINEDLALGGQAPFGMHVSQASDELLRIALDVEEQ